MNYMKILFVFFYERKLNKNYKPLKAPQSYFYNEGSKKVENFYR